MLKPETLPEIKSKLVKFLKDKKEKSNTNGFIIGLSGGIDSAVTAKLCAYTEQPTILVDLPIYQSKSESSRSEELGTKLEQDFNFKNVVYIKEDLSAEYTDFTRRVLPYKLKYFVQECMNNIPQNTELANANLRSRLRMCYLYYLANIYGTLVIGTGNKVEDFGVGFFTKYGDGAVDLAPIADLYKTEVYQLGHYIELPNSVLKAKPTDGLWDDNRTDEDQIGLTYPEMERIMVLGENVNLPQDKIDRFYQLRNSNTHKMEPIPTPQIEDHFRFTEEEASKKKFDEILWSSLENK